MDLLYFALLCSVLIFVHELGHFVFAKVFGVKVLTFSIGFGPKVLRPAGPGDGVLRRRFCRSAAS